MIELEFKSGTLVLLNPRHIVSIKGFKYQFGDTQGTALMIQSISPEPLEVLLNEVKKIVIDGKEYNPQKTTLRNIMNKLSVSIDHFR